MTATRKRLARRPRRPRGVILFVVLLVVLMLALAGMSFVATLSTENKAAHLRGRQLASSKSSPPAPSSSNSSP